MSKRTQIEQALREINQADFQRLGDAYLRRRGYTHINPIGLAFGRQKTTTGTPDTLIVRDDGKYVFVEYTTQARDVAGKFKEDVAKCLDGQATDVPVSRIAEVVLCHNGKLQPHEELSLRMLTEAGNVKLTTVGLGELAADLVEKYPALAYEFLGIEVDSGQIVPPEDFVRAYGRSAAATPLDTQFLFRDAELGAALEALEVSSIVLLTGRPGVGKSRLALEVARKYAIAHENTQVWCVYNRGGTDLFRELRTRFTEPGDYLLVVDDANRVSRFEYVVDLLRDSNETRTIKVLATVRSYALGTIEAVATPFGVAEAIQIEPMTGEQIRGLVEQAYGITHYLYLERIVAIAEGNPRLALMAASLAVDERNLASLNDVTTLYDAYFRSVKREIDALSDPKLALVAAVVAFFRSVDRTHSEQMGIISDTFGIDPAEFWSSVRRLHELEVFDLYAEEVVRVSDQVLATYLFYVAAFRDKLFDLSKLLISCFPRFRQRVIDVLNPVVSTFDTATIQVALKAHVAQALDVFSARGDSLALFELIETFASLVPERALTLAHDNIEALGAESMQPEAISFEPSKELAPRGSVLSVLRHFSHAPDAERKIALELTLAYAAKRPADIPLIARMLVEDYGITHRSFAEGYVVQRQVASVLRAAAEAGRNSVATGLLFTFAEHALQTAFHRLEPGRGLAFTSFNFNVAETPELRAVRSGLWDEVLALGSKAEYRSALLRLLRRYLRSGLGGASAPIVKADMHQLVPFFLAHFDVDDPSTVVVGHEVMETAARLQIDVDLAVDRRFAGGLFEFYELLTGSKTERMELGWSEYAERRSQQFDAYAATLDLGGTAQFLDTVKRFYPALTDHEAWQAADATTQVLRRLIMRDPAVFETAVLPRLRNDGALRIEPRGIVDVLIDRLGSERALDVLTAEDYPHRGYWLLCYCAALPQTGIGPRQVQLLLDGYRNAPAQEIPQWMDHLLNFEAVDRSVPLEVARILDARLPEDHGVAQIAANFFSRFGELGKKMPGVFHDDVPLAKRLYLKVAKSEQGFDHDAAAFDALVTLDPLFVREWVSTVLESGEWRSRHDDSRDYSRLWVREDVTPIVDSIFETVRTTDQAAFSFEPYFLVFFRIRDDHPDRATIEDRQDAWLTTAIKTHCADPQVVTLLFGVICELADARRQKHIATLLRCNQDFNLFSSIQLQSSSRGWTGSAVPMLEAEIAFYRSLLDLCDSVALLKHREYLQSLIESLEGDVEHEKKRDFMRD